MSDSMSALEYENLEQKYIETKTKLKKTLQYNERYNIQIQKLTKKVKRLEQENKQLESQVHQFQAKNASDSDTSSQTNFHQERSNMIELVHSKNQQISDLLKDIEESENENVILREKLTEAKEQLAKATSEITNMTATLKAEEKLAREKDEILNKLSAELKQLQLDFKVIEEEKVNMDKKLKIVKIEAKEKEEEWKILLKEKEKQILCLNESILSVKTSPSLKKENKTTKELHMEEVDKLKIALSETEVHLEELKSEMENCTVDLKENAKVVNKLKSEKQLLEMKIKEMKDSEKEMKEQLKKVHDRCQNLQTEVEYANKLTKIFENDLSTIKSQIKGNEVIVNLEEIQTLKIEKLLHEKQIVGLIKDINKLQELCNIFEIENTSLRQQLGLSAEDTVDIDKDAFSETKKQKKSIEKLQIEVKSVQEDKIKLKLENKNLKQQINNLMNNSRSSTPKKEVKDNNNRSADMKALSEENEALRKGLHEILNSVQSKNETSPRELKSDILERLLKALDVKHISGWYHPAMRLQAELHTLEGINSELREQLYEARTELDKFKSKTVPLKDDQVEHKKVDNILLDNLRNDNENIEQIRIHIMKIVMHFSEKNLGTEEKLQEEFEILKHQVDLLHLNCNKEKTDFLKKLDDFQKSALQSSEFPLTDLNATSEIQEIINLARKKEKYLFLQIAKLQDELLIIKSKNSSSIKTYLSEIEMLLKTNQFLRSKIQLKEKQYSNLISLEAHKKVQNALNENIKKFRVLMMEVERQKEDQEFEREVLKKTEMDLTKENRELREKLETLINKSYQETYKKDQNVLSLSQKLANTEMQALSEKHRADHTNNLYELVKEQLKKSEEKFLDFSKYGEGLLQKNLALQEQIATLEDQVTNFIDPAIYKDMENGLNALLKDTEKLRTENSELEKKLCEQSNLIDEASSWKQEKEQELLSLKHKIVDLSVTTDEKALIDQLHNDLLKSRSEIRDQHLQIDFLRKEISSWDKRWSKLYSEYDNQKSQFESERKSKEKKIEILQDIVLKQRVQYHGCIPLAIQELFIEKLKTINNDKHEAFIALRNIKKANEKGNLQIDYLQQKILNQDVALAKLENELFAAYNLIDFDKTEKEHDVSAIIIKRKTPTLVKELVLQESLDPVKEVKSDTKMLILRNVETQTEYQKKDKEDNQLIMARVQIKNLQSQLTVKENQILEKERSISETQEELNSYKEQIKDKDAKITHLENNLKDYKNRVKVEQRPQNHGGAGDGADIKINHLDEQIVALKLSLKTTQDRLKQKDVEIIKYQTLLKEDRDKHSLAAANLQQELIVLRKSLVVEQQNVKSLQEEALISRQKSAAVEKYVSQVRALEKHLAELHTQLAQLQAQLQNSHQEATRWRQMAQDRLVAMQELGKSLNEQHDKEINSFKTDYERLKNVSEASTPKKAADHKVPGYIDPEIMKLCREKDQKIEELSAKLKEIERGEIDKKAIHHVESDTKHINKELDILRNKYEGMITREKNLKDEIKDLKDQLSKRTNLSARSQKSERTVKEQLQRKITTLEREIEDLNEKLTQQQLLNEKHRISANEDFEKWKKQKYWQENCEKYKNKLQEREGELEKLQQTCTGYRLIIERLEREKINLENRIKSLKSDQRNLVSDQENALLKDENNKLIRDLSALQTKMEMLQHGSGALGAALLQEKLEGQERKIAILELSAKGTIEVRNELERLQTSMANLQKKNLCLEAENLELKMDMEKYRKETPHLQEQIQHLENYIELLKSENQRNQASNIINDSNEEKKVSQLERTVFILKRVVEKLQVENKRLVSGKRPLSDRSPSADKIRRDYLRLKDQHKESLQKIKDLETQLQSARKLQRSHPGDDKTEQLLSQFEEVKEQLAQKTHLLDKVKALLHAAAAREKQLLQEISELKCSENVQREVSVDIPSTIEEVSEVSSDV